VFAFCAGLFAAQNRGFIEKKRAAAFIHGQKMNKNGGTRLYC